MRIFVAGAWTGQPAAVWRSAASTTMICAVTAVSARFTCRCLLRAHVRDAQINARSPDASRRPEVPRRRVTAAWDLMMEVGYRGLTIAGIAVTQPPESSGAEHGRAARAQRGRAARRVAPDRSQAPVHHPRCGCHARPAAAFRGDAKLAAEHAVGQRTGNEFLADRPNSSADSRSHRAVARVDSSGLDSYGHRLQAPHPPRLPDSPSLTRRRIAPAMHHGEATP